MAVADNHPRQPSPPPPPDTNPTGTIAAPSEAIAPVTLAFGHAIETAAQADVQNNAPIDDHKLAPHRSSTSHDESTVADVTPYSEKPRIPQDSKSANNDNLTKLDSKVIKAAQSAQQNEKTNKATTTKSGKKGAAAAAAAADSQEPDAFQHLPADQAEILRRQILVTNVSTGFFAMFRYATRWDLIIIVVSLVAAIAAGAALPLMTILFGQLQGTFQDFFTGQMSYDDFIDEMSGFVLYFVYLAIAEFVTVYISTVGFIYTGEHITGKMRERYLESCLRQNIGYFDKEGAGSVTTMITSETSKVQEGISEKIPITVSAFATFIAAFVIGLVTYWRLSLILFAAVVAIVLTMGLGGGFTKKYETAAQAHVASGGNLAGEAIASIRNSVAFGTQDRLAKKYDAYLNDVEHSSFMAKAAIGVMFACMFLFMYLNYGLAFWVGSGYVVDGTMTVAKMLTVVMASIIGAFNLGNVAPNIQAFAVATATAQKIYTTIDRQSPLDPTLDTGLILEKIEGTIRLENVSHRYPSRPDVLAMDNVSLTIPAGQTTALVGSSGSGKSTIVGLVERFYEPIAGTVFLDGHDISTLNLRWLRQQIALVGQEPALFNTTIFENIRHGLIGTPHETETNRERLMELVVDAAKKANIHDVIAALPEGYDTSVGEQGFKISGGQKQRIAIARAIVSDPKILLLDESTSALDTKSEGVVQAALDKAAAGRTTISIAHRLSTIKNAYNIVVMSQGSIVEQGSHNQLLEKEGAYARLVTAQHIAEVVNHAATDSEQEEIDQQEEAEIARHLSRQKSSGLARQASNVLDPADDIEGNLVKTTTTTSASSIALRRRATAPEAPDYGLWTRMKFIASYNKPEWFLLVIGLLFSIVAGAGNPVGSIFFAKEVVTLSVPINSANRDRIKSDADFWCQMYLMLAFVLLIALGAENIAFAKASARLIRRVRYEAFRSLLRQDISFFDKDGNSAGALTAFLSTETANVAGLSGATLGTILMVLSTLIIAIALSLAIGWKLALVCISTIPLVVGCGFFRFRMLAHFQRRSKEAYESSASFASEAIGSIRTVASLTREANVLDQYREALVLQKKRSLRSVLKSSLLYAAAQSILFLCFALGFWYGGTLIGKGEYDMFQFFLCFMAIIFGSQSAGAIFSFAPDMGKAYSAAGELKTLFDRKPVVDSWSNEGEKIESVDGTIEFRDVHFRYPMRPTQPVLRGLNLIVKPGQYVALVGPSGCGKSTAISLIERFYDPITGSVLMDGKELTSLNINQYRSHISLVSQEPTLYQGTIRENILLGSPRDESEVTDAEVEMACREANIYDFIVSLPEGFNTNVGSKGTLLSGGQKQRIAIARALIRNPKILLLDEASSALDSESEAVVQAALDKAAKGRTTIAVAHRLSTIQKADVIYMFDQGRVVERGTHQELMKLNGRYAELVRLQSLDAN